jgi:hypothetical protein
MPRTTRQSTGAVRHMRHGMALAEGLRIVNPFQAWGIAFGAFLHRLDSISLEG